MIKKLTRLKVLFLCGILLIVIFTGCIEEKQDLNKSYKESQQELLLDQPSILPDWKDGDYHDYYETKEMLNDFNSGFSDLVEIFTIGRSVLGKNIECPVVAIHGDYDPHPAEGVEKPLASILKNFRFILLQNCGHKPWIEKHAKDIFYEILKQELQFYFCLGH